MEPPSPLLRISGYTISQTAIDYFPKDLTSRMKQWYKTSGSALTDKQLFLALENNFGNEITQKICIPQHLSQGGCLVAAIYLLRENA